MPLAILGLAVMGFKTLVLFSFEDKADLGKIMCNNTKIERTTKDATEGRYALKVEFQPAEWPNIYFRIGQAFQNGDWSQQGGMAMDVRNPEKEAVTLFLRVDDDFSADGVRHCRTASATIPPGAKVTLVMPFKLAIPSGMRGGPPLLRGAQTMNLYGPEIDWSHIVAFQFFLAKPPRSLTLILDNIRLLPPPKWEGIVDRYGQYTGDTWKGKVKSDEDLKKQREEEEKWLKLNPPPSDRDEFGGWKEGPQLRATGFFRTAYVVEGKEVEPPANLREGKGRWWLVTPSGHLFFSLGVDCVWEGEGSPIEGREYMFTWLPKPPDPFSEFYQGGWVHFYKMNLRRKYGEDWRKIWPQMAVRRLLSWGFNTIGNWSAWEVFRLRKVPYTVAIHYGGDFARFGGMPDAFDERFQRTVEQTIDNVTKEWRNDPWCLGYFVDNELPWSGWGGDPVSRYELPRRALASGSDLFTKREFTRLLQNKYGNIENLNKAWNVNVASWEELLEKPLNLPPNMTDACIEDLKEMLIHYARRYFQCVRDALRRYAPNQLYLGCRFASRPWEVVKVAGEYCDVVSFNIYAREVNEREWAFTNELGKPCIIGEFHFGALDRGMFHTGLVPVANQEERGKAYQHYVRSVFNLPAFVGCHWFQYIDEPLTGRFDGENYNIGFVSGVDYPYWELVRSARELNSQVYKILGRK